MAGSTIEEETKANTNHTSHQVEEKKSSFLNFFLGRRFSLASSPASTHRELEKHDLHETSAMHAEGPRSNRRRSLAGLGQSWFARSFKSSQDQFHRSEDLPNPKLSKDLIRHTFPSKKGLTLPESAELSPAGSFRLGSMRRNLSHDNLHGAADASPSVDSEDRNLSAKETIKRCIVSGTLKFRERRILGSSWTSMFCVLKRNGKFHVYTDKDDVFPRVTLDLRTFEIPKVKNSLEFSLSKKDPLLPALGRTSSSPGVSWSDLHRKMEVYTFKAENAVDKKQWMTSLRTVKRISSQSSDDEHEEVGFLRLASA